MGIFLAAICSFSLGIGVTVVTATLGLPAITLPFSTFIAGVAVTHFIRSKNETDWFSYIADGIFGVLGYVSFAAFIGPLLFQH